MEKIVNKRKKAKRLIKDELYKKQKKTMCDLRKEI